MSNYKLIFVSYVVLMIYWLEIDFLTPAFISAAKAFHVPYKYMQSIMGLDLLFRCASMFVIGHLSDCIGRRKVIINSALVVVVGSLICYVANSFVLFSIGKIMQGVACSVSALTYAVIGDNKSKKDAFFIVSIIHFLLIVGMVTAPILGSKVVHYFSWKGSFFVIFVFSIFAYITSHLLPKREIITNTKFSLKYATLKFIAILKKFSVTKYVFMYSILIGFLSGWTVEYPGFLTNVFGIKIQNIGYYQSVVLFSSAMTNLYIGFFKSHIDPLIVLRKGVIFCNIVALAIASLLFMKNVPVELVILSICVFSCGISLITCSAITYYYKNFAHSKGSATSVDVVVQNLLASVGVYLIIAIDLSSVAKLVLMMIGTTVICNALYFLKKERLE